MMLLCQQRESGNGGGGDGNGGGGGGYGGGGGGNDARKVRGIRTDFVVVAETCFFVLSK